MRTRHHIVLLPLVLELGCVALNPAYQDGESRGEDGSGGSSASSTIGGSTTASSETTTSTHGGTMETTAGSSGNDVPPTLVEFVDEAWEDQFGAAEQIDNFHWDAATTSLQLVDGVIAGRFESRIFDAGEETSWKSLQWGPRAAYGLPLRPPRDWQANAYAEGSLDSAGLSLLLPFEDGPWAPEATLRDVSGGGFDGVWAGTETAPQPQGVFGLGLENLDESGGEHFTFADGNYPAEDPFTWTLWFRTAACIEGQTMIALDSPALNAPGSTGTTFIGCGYAETNCTGASNRGYAFIGIQGAGGAPARACSDAPIDDGLWHFLAMRRRVDNGTQTVDVFVDGEDPVSSPTALGVTDVSIHDAGPDAETFTVAGGNAEPVKGAATYPGRGEYDQVALWNRALTTEELRTLYARGAQRFRMQVRACAAPDCSDQAFVGPNADPEQSFLDPGPDAEHEVDISDLGLSGRYVQYELEMLRPLGVASPATSFVRVSGQHD